MKTFHLTAREHDWLLTQEGWPQPLGTYRSKDRALEEAIDMAGAQGAALRMRRRDGTVAEGRPQATGPGLRCLPVTPEVPPIAQKASPARHSTRRRKGGAHRVTAP